MTEYKKIRVHGRTHLLKERELTRESWMPHENYMNTGLCLAGVLLENESVAMFEERMAEARIRIQKAANNIKFPNKNVKKKKL